MFDGLLSPFYAGEIQKKFEEKIAIMKGNIMPTTAGLEQGKMAMNIGLAGAMQRADGVAAQMRPKEVSETSKINNRLAVLLGCTSTSCSRLADIETNLLGPHLENERDEQKNPHDDTAFGAINRQLDELAALLLRIEATTERLGRV